MQPQPSIAELRKKQEAVKYAHRLLARGIDGREQCVPLAKKFGYSGKECQEIYELMLDEVYWSIVEAKTNPFNFRIKRYKRTRGNEKAPWSVRISAQIELDDLFNLFEVAKQPDGWENRHLLDAWNFYQTAVDSDTISEAQRHRAEKRMDLLMYGPKRRRNSSEAQDQRHRDMTRPGENGRTQASRQRYDWCDPGPQDFANWEESERYLKGESPEPAESTESAEVATRSTAAASHETTTPSCEPRNTCPPAEEPSRCEPSAPRCAEELSSFEQTVASKDRREAIAPPAEFCQPAAAFNIKEQPAQASQFSNITAPNPESPDSAKPASPVRLVAAVPAAPRSGGSRLMEPQSDSADRAPPPQAQPPP